MKSTRSQASYTVYLLTVTYITSNIPHSHAMSVEDKLKVVASSALESLFSSRAVTIPISSFDLLTRVVASGPPPVGLFPGPDPTPRFRLVDLARFERILERLSESWDSGKISLARDQESDGSLTVMDVQLGISSAGQVERSPTAGRRKRKRVVDEDDDSAAGGVDEEEILSPDKDKDKVEWKPSPSTLESLNKTMKEVYELLRRGSARGRLLAEQVSVADYRIHTSLAMFTDHVRHAYPVPVSHWQLRTYMRPYHQGRMREGAARNTAYDESLEGRRSHL